MDIKRFKHQHADILGGIVAVRKLAHQGIVEHAADIAGELKTLARSVTQHLAFEDRVLYPLIEKGADERLSQMSKRYQHDMQGLAAAFIKFVQRWGDAAALAGNPEAFRSDANVVLKNVHDRVIRENREFYPAIEAAQSRS